MYWTKLEPKFSSVWQNFYYQSCQISLWLLSSEIGWILFNKRGAGPKRVKAVLPSEIGLMESKCASIWLSIMWNTLREFLFLNLLKYVEYKWSLEKRVNMPHPPANLITRFMSCWLIDFCHLTRWGVFELTSNFYHKPC